MLERLALLRKHMPEHPWPAFDDADLSDLLAEACAGRRSLDEVLSGQSLASLLMNRLPYPLDRLLEQHAPESLEVPTGNRIGLQYGRNAAPILAVRLTKIFSIRVRVG